MSDYKKLIEALRLIGKEQDCNECEAGRWHNDFKCCLFEDAAAAIEELLPKRGKWELIDGAEPMRWGCSRCKYMSWETSNYCPRCGAKMEAQE